jgi:hypothetical protein
MSTTSLPWRLAAIIALSALTSLAAFAADIALISTKGGISRITIDGPIAKGDYERLIDVILAAGVDIDTVSLSSPGGDAIEAMRLGRLIRSFGLRAEAPKRFTNESVCPIGAKSRLGCSCDSACLFLYLGAVHRYGDSLGVHRVYLNPESQRRLSLDEGKRISRVLEEATKGYFEEMRAPRSLWDLVNSAASDSIKYLTTEYVEQNLYGYSRDSEDWLIARCGSASRAFTRFYRNARSSESDKALAAYTKIKTCFDHHLRAERLRNFRPALITALENADPNHITYNSRLEAAKSLIDLELADLIGMKIDKAALALMIFGFGQVDSQSMKPGEGYILKRTLTISLSSALTVSSVQINLFGEPEDNTKPFTGQFLMGFDKDSPPQKFIIRYGEPFKQGRLFGGQTAGLWMEGPTHDVWAIFEIPSNSLRSIRFNVPGYWRSVGR